MAKPTLKKIAPVKRKKVRLGAASAIKSGPLAPDRHIPFLVEPTAEGADLIAWATRHQPWIDERLLEHGAILFRGFDVPGLERFQAFIEAASSDLLEYQYRSTPRTAVEGKIYTSTEYPADKWIPMHNENAYSRNWPMKVFFYCELAAREGGMTPIADSHRVYERIPTEIRDEFAAKKVMYVRNYRQGIDLPWTEVFNTEDKAEVEAFCERAGIELEWRGDDLRTRQICQAVARHPKSGKPLWFNQAHLFHVSSLEPEAREALLELCAEEDLPRNTYLGDGSPIPDEALAAIRQAFDEEMVTFPWREGDVLLLDNMAVAHGRTPFQGPRKIRVGMTEPYADAELTA